MTNDQDNSSQGEPPQGEPPLDTPEGQLSDTAPQLNEIDPQTVIVAMQAENADLKDRVLRAVAEMENLRKRSQREMSDARTYAIADFARDMLAATDNLDRALMSLPQVDRDDASPAMKSLIEGIEMTDREMQRLMQKNGVRPIMAEGEKFNPHKHQAMFEVPNDLVPAGTIVQVMQPGFEIGDRILRPAMVGVAKGGPKPGQAKSPDTADESNVTSIDMSIKPKQERPDDFSDGEELHIDKEV